HPLWIDTVDEDAPEAWMERQLGANEKAAEQKLANRRLFEIVSGWAFDRRASFRRRGKRNDLVLHVVRTPRGSLIVEPPATLAGIRDLRGRPSETSPAYTYQLEMPRKPILLRWATFRRKLQRLT